MTGQRLFSGAAMAAMAAILVLPCVVLPCVAYGATPDAQPSDGGAIVVTGQGLAPPPATPAYDTQTLSRDVLVTSSAGSLEDALLGVAGFQQFRRSDSRAANPSAQGITLRALGGNAASRTLVLLDGVPMGDPMFGSIPFADMPAGRLGQVVVTRGGGGGGGAGSFGAGAVAGTVAMESASPDQLGLVSGAGFVDDRGESQLGATLAPKLGAGFVELSGNWDHGQGYYTTPAAQIVPATAGARYDSWSGALRMVMPVAPDVELQSRIAAFDDNRTLRFAGANSMSRGEDGSVRLVGRGRWQFDALAYVQARDFSNIVLSSSTYRMTLNQKSTPSTGLGAKFELRPPVGGGQVLRLGSDWRRTEGQLWEDAFSGTTGKLTSHRHAGGRNDDVGFFAEDDLKLGALTLTAGGRADRWVIADGYATVTNPAGAVTSACTTCAGRQGWAGSGRVGAVWQVASPVALRASAYSGIRMPTINELYRTFTVFPVTTLSNAALTNERLRGYEGGVDFIPMKGVLLTVTAFDNRVENAIANVTISADGNTRMRQNVNAIHAKGLEFGAHGALGAFTLDAALALTDAHVEQSATGQYALNGLRPAQTPKLAGSATLGWHPRAGWALAGTVRRVGAAYEDDLNSANSVLPAATTFGAYAQVPLRPGVALVLRGENLGNATVVTRNQAGSMDLGEPRTVWFGVRIGK